MAYRKKIKKRAATDLIPLQKIDLIAKIRIMDNARDRALASMIYLTACRTSEVLSITKGQIKLERDYGIEWMKIYNIPILKLPKPKTKVIVINMEVDGYLAQIILDYVSNMEDDERIFPISRRRVHQILTKNMNGIFPHALRSWRCTHLLKPPYNFDSYELQSYVGWNRIQTSLAYVNISQANIQKKLAGLR